jgi:hypothetical protein
MFDNLGLGEFMTIAIFALLFFGPERLPQMGAKLGQWLGKLTQQSKLFMYQWREEALAIHGAVEEVKGIRDEIMAARNEIAGTVTSAQGDIAQSLDDVKGTLKNSQVTYDKMVKEAEAGQRTNQAAGAAKQAGGEVEAIEKSQAILAGMQTKLGDVSLESGRAQAVESQEDERVTPPADESLLEADAVEITDVETTDVSKAPSLPGAREQTQQILAAMQRKLSGESAEESPPVVAGAAPVVGETPPVVEQTAPADVVDLVQAGDDRVEPLDKESKASQEVLQRIPGSRVRMEKVEKRTGPSAHEQTQSILDRMQRKLAGEPVEELDTLVVEEKEAVEPGPQDEWSQTHDLIQSALGSSRSKEPTGPKRPAWQESELEQSIAQDVQVQDVVPANGTDEKIRELSDQVSTLQSELKSLHQALDALRAEMLIKTALPARIPTGVTEERV